MTGWRDTRPANWAKTVARLRREAQGLREHGFTVVEPEDLETPAHQRIAQPSASL